MPVRVGDVELIGLQAVHVEEGRALVEQRVPGQQGHSFQDLGRGPVTLVLEGILFGEGVQDDLEALRAAQADAEPRAFAADIATGVDFTHVVVAEVQVAQSAGYRARYTFVLKVREHVEPPAPSALPAINAGVAADGAGFMGAALAAAEVLQDPAKLPGLLDQFPDLLQHLDMADLGNSIADMASELTGVDFSGIVSALSKIDPQLLSDLFEVIKDPGKLGDFIEKYAKEGLDILSDLTGVDLSAVSELVQAFVGGADFLKKLEDVIKRAKELLESVADFNPFEGLEGVVAS
jgi:hypothetical protein